MSDLVGNPEDRFFRVAAQLLIISYMFWPAVNLHVYFNHMQKSSPVPVNNFQSHRLYCVAQEHKSAHLLYGK